MTKNEQVHSRNIRRVITQKGPPPLAWWSSPFDHVFGDARLRDLKPKLEQFAMDTWRAPKRIFHAQPLDQRVQLRLDLRSALPVGAISTANSGESQPDANAPASRAG